MVDAIISFGVEKLWDLLSQEYEQFQGVEDQVTELKDNLDLLKSFLKDADAKKHTNEMVRHCVEKIKEIVYDAEDIIETCILKEKVGKKTGIMKRIRRFACTIVDRRELASDIGGISKRISKVIQDMQSFGVQQMITDGSRSSHPVQERKREMRQTFPNDYECDLVGLEANVKKLVGLVEKDDIQIISVTGMGGLGKTTLARQVFNHEDVKQQFNQRLAWVCVSQEFTRISVWQTILQNLTSKERKDEILKMKEAELQGELFRLLETSKSLIVFDDLWKEEDWDLIKPIFPPKKGWKVLLTSRNERVAMCGDMRYINFKPECLTIEDSWTLFQRIAIPRKDAPEFKIDEEMEEMGKQMIKHCGGLPLAIKVLGGLLAAKYTLHDWKRLSENIGSHLVIGRTSGNNGSINHVLSLSFEELPSYLKHCFLYLAHFPEDHKINVEKLSYYWAAEGIFEPRKYDGETIQDVGDSYIEELMRRNMVISEREATTLRFDTCHLHDMMREVCLFKAKEENFLQITSSRPPTANFQSHVTSRRFVSHNPTTLHVERDINNPKLRSLVVVQVNEPLGKRWKLSCSSYTRLELLRVLDLFRAEFKGGKLPSGIGKLIHLRYLSLKDAKVSHLPSSLGNLLLLIYLNLDTRESIFMPNVLMGMQELRYLALPRSMHKKTKLELSNLEKLETLLHFSTENSSVRDLDRMTKLRTLSIYTRGEGCATETLSSSLSELRRLEHLTIFLQACRLVEDPMPIIEKLVQLKELNLRYQSFSGRRMVCSSGGFSQLQKLIIEGLEEWEEWIVEEGSMPLLHYLDVSYCPKLKKLPAGGFPQLQKLLIWGLEEWEEWIVEEGSMPLLHTLEIWNCPKLKKLPNGFPQLQKLRIDGLKEWEEWIVEEGSMPLLHTLSIRKCPNLKKLSAGGFPQLQKLYLVGLKEWEKWIVEEGSVPLLQYLRIEDCPKLKKLPAGGFPQLQELSIWGLKEWEEWIVEEGSMPLLHSLSIFMCPKLKKLPACGFPQLQDLSLHGLKEWEEWIVEEGSIPLLHTLSIRKCPKLKKLPAVGFSQLQKLIIQGLEEWEEWIVEEGSMPLLHYLNISNCEKLKKLPAVGFPQLQELKLEGLEEWEEWIVEEGSMPLLHFLEIWNCPKLKKLPNGFPQLQKLRIDGLKEWEEWIVEEGSMPLLHTLSIRKCPKLKKLPAVGFPQLQMLSLRELDEWEEWIVEEGSMPLLHFLSINNCEKLKELPDGLRFIYSLKELRIYTDHLEFKGKLSEGGEDYYKVQHIPSVEFY